MTIVVPYILRPCPEHARCGIDVGQAHCTACRVFNGLPERLTQALVMSILRSREISFRPLLGEFRVAFYCGTADEREASASYQTDLDDALRTGLAMADDRDAQDRIA